MGSGYEKAQAKEAFKREEARYSAEVISLSATDIIIPDRMCSGYIQGHFFKRNELTDDLSREEIKIILDGNEPPTSGELFLVPGCIDSEADSVSIKDTRSADLEITKRLLSAYGVFSKSKASAVTERIKNGIEEGDEYYERLGRACVLSTTRRRRSILVKKPETAPEIVNLDNPNIICSPASFAEIENELSQGGHWPKVSSWDIEGTERTTDFALKGGEVLTVKWNVLTGRVCFCGFLNAENLVRQEALDLLAAHPYVDNSKGPDFPGPFYSSKTESIAFIQRVPAHVLPQRPERLCGVSQPIQTVIT